TTSWRCIWAAEAAKAANRGSPQHEHRFADIKLVPEHSSHFHVSSFFSVLGSFLIGEAAGVSLRA
ncbi:unnamed protein product, partial [Rotaria magnacalcarata]